MGDKHETPDPPQLDGVFQQRGRNHVRLRPWGWVILRLYFRTFYFYSENICQGLRYRNASSCDAFSSRIQMHGGRIVRLGDSWTKCQHEFSVLPRLLCTLPFKPTRCARWFIARWTSHAALACNYFHVTVVRIKLSSPIERVFALPRVTRVLVRFTFLSSFFFFVFNDGGKVLRFTEISLISQIFFSSFFSKVIIKFSYITMSRGNFLQSKLDKRCSRCCWWQSCWDFKS